MEERTAEGLDTPINRREFLVGASTAVVGSSLLGDWPAVAAEAGPERPAEATEPGPVSPTKTATADLTTGVVQANGLEFHYLEAGEGPLALCFHGFPDSPFTYRYLAPALAAAGYHAVVPYMRGYYPTKIPGR